MTAEQAVIGAALIALVGAFVTIIPDLLDSGDPKNEDTSKATSEKSSPKKVTGASSALELVDVSPAGRGEETVFLDVKMRNLGSKTSILKRATAHVSEWRVIGTCAIGAPMPVSSRYKMTLPLDPKKAKFDVSIEMNDFLKANEATRIRIETGLDTENPFIDGMLFRLTLELSFDKSGKVTSHPVVISLPGKLSPPKVWEEMQDDPYFEGECARENLKDLRYILKLPGRRDGEMEAITNAL
ncbi:hypothetical protein [Streptomyces sp. enrichment culture]|uniref:hypothetical protein n=1 Tax=Streptomyces sp. enrichment culture TaxID=1795815 RepID=UPI003F544D1D